ncbi:hypothetical protein [Halobacterium sp. CBA1126]|uniref:hypothetical protein n=1 Tax=Halobacterium sp. CBA1126 TaxID=2668074 RepID=UPI0012FC50A9|nr:hypothetical protein [Halobacterium sp. CBA1126]MUV59960.1 hypothetical protein [Halobacterium sp. CBA1126]
MTQPTIDELNTRDDHELETGDITVDKLAEYSKANTCNGFAFDYLETHDDHNVVVKDALIEGSDVAHCYVYDATRDLTIDVTLGQFNAGPSIGVWDGDHHPYRVEGEEVREWTSREAFQDRYANKTHTDFIC